MRRVSDGNPFDKSRESVLQECDYLLLIGRRPHDPPIDPMDPGTMIGRSRSAMRQGQWKQA